MNANDELEKLAKQFYKETGLMAPFKDEPAAVAGDPEYNQEYRRREYDKWIRNRTKGDEMLKAGFVREVKEERKWN